MTKNGDVYSNARFEDEVQEEALRRARLRSEHQRKGGHGLADERELPVACFHLPCCFRTNIHDYYSWTQ